MLWNTVTEYPKTTMDRRAPFFKGLSCSLVIPMLLLILSGCNKDKKDPNENNGTDFDRAEMLTNYGENLIIPAYEDLEASINDLGSAADTFTNQVNAQNLDGLQSSFKEAYSAWQYCSTYEFGPAKNQAFRTYMNTFPTDTAAIEDSISSGSWNLDHFATEAMQGFPAVDYLLYDPYNGDQAILNDFNNGPQARKDFLLEVIGRMKSNTSKVLQEWEPSGGDHLNTFISSLGNDVGSSLGLLVNQLNYDLEILKNAELGIPLGKKSLGNPKPKKCQAYFGSNSVHLAMEHLRAVRDIYTGYGTDGDKKGLDDHLVAVDSKTLDTKIQSQFQVALDALNKVQSPLAEQVVNSPAQTEEAYNEVQKLVVLLKTDLPSELGVQITYQDNDGD